MARDISTKSTTDLIVSTFSTKVYGWMSLGLAVTAITAWFIWTTGLYSMLMPFWWLMGLTTLGIGLMISFRLETMQLTTLASLFLAYAFVEGLFFGTVLPAYAISYGGGVIWSAFGVGAVVYFAAMLYGIVTKSDLTRIGTILSFALLGLIGVTIVFAILSFFFNMTWMNLVISYIGLVIFVGLTAWDAQTIRRMSTQIGQGSDSILPYKMALVMALRMYINVIMIFWYLLQIFASSSNKR
ncbi:MAG: Bax inhibitor-1/YccA family protein [Chlamydiae bacterium]|nr:Bax inhibitor-1/YccA family protein [Chlamydiota bacterium]